MKKAIVTGATGAIGAAIARLLAEKSDMHVLLACRNESKGNDLANRIKEQTGNHQVEVALVDVSRKLEIDELADGMEGAIDILINNAAVTPRQRRETGEGIELQWATNVLGYNWMTDALTPHLSKSDAGRIVNVASHWAGGLRLDDPEFRTRRYDNNAAYRQSKQANRMLSVAYAKKLADNGITVNSCHPGNVRSTLSTNLGFGGHESPEQGAATPVHLATSADVAGETGGFYSDSRRVRCAFSDDAKAIDELVTLCRSY